MATQTHVVDATRSAAAKKAAATRAAKAAEAKRVVEGPKGKVLEQPAEQHDVPDEQRKGERSQQQQNAIAQFTASQMNTPAAHEVPQPDPEQIKQQAFRDAVEALAKSMGVDPAPLLNAQPAGKQPRAPRQDRQQQNGITRPASGGATGQIWDVADRLSAANNGQPCSIADLRAAPELRQTNENTLKTQYARWRSYHGIKGRVGPQGGQAAQAAPQEERRQGDRRAEQAAQQ